MSQVSSVKTREVVFAEKASTDPDDDGDRIVLDVPEDEDPGEWFFDRFGCYPAAWYVR